MKLRGMQSICQTAAFAAVLATATTQATAAASASADYIIVGAGTAGCVLASKLCTGLPDSKVVLIERAAPRSAEAVCLLLVFCCLITYLYATAQRLHPDSKDL
jgi:hypothetical protein